MQLKRLPILGILSQVIHVLFWQGEPKSLFNSKDSSEAFPRIS